MASGKEYLQYVLDQLSSLDGVAHRAMMGEYILYFQGKIVGGIYDDRLLLKQTKASATLLPQAPREVPYPGAKEMLLVENTDDRDFLYTLLTALEKELPYPKAKKRKN